MRHVKPKQAENIVRPLVNVFESHLHGPRPLTWWTGALPSATNNNSLPLLNLKTCSMEEVRAYFRNTWFLTESLFAGLQGSSAFVRPPAHGLRHPMIFYYGHPAVLYVNTMKRAGLLHSGIDPQIEAEFEVGVDEMRWDDLQSPKTGWASVETIHQYRQEVFQTVDKVLQDTNVIEGLRDLSANASWSIPMAFEHERIHLETSSVLIRELPLEFVRHPETFPLPHPGIYDASTPGGRPSFRQVSPGKKMVKLGKPRNFPTFGWDNEYGEKYVEVQNFEVSDTQITNGMFYEFVMEGGYDKREYWTDSGWHYRQFRNAEHPKFWVKKSDGSFALRLIFSETETMPWNFPAIVNVFEAEAYCKWLQGKNGKSYRLLTEGEFQVLAGNPSENAMTKSPEEIDFIMRPNGSSLNMNLNYSSEGPVDTNIAGNVWNWVEDSFNPLPGFQEHELYDDFSLPCFDGEHTLIMGGCFISTGDYASSFARYHFRPHFHQHAGFRVVHGAEARTSCENNMGPYAADCKGKSPYRTSVAHTDANGQPGGQVQADYENDQWVARYLHLHYPPENLPKHVPQEAWDFPKRCGLKLISEAKSQGAAMGTALDLGCATGGSSFVLSSAYDKVYGIDLGERFIKMANELKENGEMEYRLTSEGDKKHVFTAKVDSIARSENVQFMVGDAMDLSPHQLPKFDAILMGNLLCRVPNPKNLLASLPHMLNPGGIIMNTSPFSWKPEFTPRSDWLGGGIARSAPNCTSAEGLQMEMEKLGFSLLSEEDMPLCIIHHDRFCELISSSATIWQKQN